VIANKVFAASNCGLATCKSETVLAKGRVLANGRMFVAYIIGVVFVRGKGRTAPVP